MQINLYSKKQSATLFTIVHYFYNFVFQTCIQLYKIVLYLYNQLFLSVIDYGLGGLILSDSKCERLEHIHNEEMRTILGCTGDTPITMIKYMLRLLSIRSRHRMAQVKTYICVVGDGHHSLLGNFNDAKGKRSKRKFLDGTS